MAPYTPQQADTPILQSTTTTPGGTNLAPPPQSGVPNPFGLVPGNIPAFNPAGDLAAQYPNLSQTNEALSGDILNKLNGYLSPSTLNSIQRQFGGQGGIASGMPGSGLTWNNVYGNIIGAQENQRQQGIQDYVAAIPAVSQTQTVSPAIQAIVAEQNAVNQSAPNPQMAQTYAQQLFNQYLNQVRGPAGGRGSPFSGFGGDFGSPSGGSGALGFGFGTMGRSNTSPASYGGTPSGNIINDEDWLYGATNQPSPLTDEDWLGY